MADSIDIAVIGAGPAGLMAAEVLARGGRQVTVFDRMPSPGRKLLMAGHGGLNLTHSEPLEAFILKYGAAQAWLEPVIRAFPPEALAAWCEGLGQKVFVGSSGRVFPTAMKAAPLLRAWLRQLEGLGARYAPRHRWLGWEKEALVFEGEEQMLRVHAQQTLLALGGASWPRLGSDGGWVEILARQGVAVAPLRPANCGFVVPWSDYFGERFAGVPLKPVALSFGGQRRQGEAMVTRQGLEGGVVYALSGLIRDAVEKAGEAVVLLDLRPDMDVAALTRKLTSPRGSQSFSTYLRKAGFPALVGPLLRECCPEAAKARPEALAALLKALPLRFTATAGIARAISSAGGICHSEVDAHFMLRRMPGVFVAGEMLDWEASTGGYLLQGCFSTAVAAAKGMFDYAAQL